MPAHQLYKSLCAVGLCLGLAACTTTQERTTPQIQPIRDVKTNTSDVQQFDVPGADRSLLADRLRQLVPGTIVDARISNGWRTTAAATARPNDYATCVSANAGEGTSIFLMVKSGHGIGDVIANENAVQRCSDTSRASRWVTLPEAMTR